MPNKAARTVTHSTCVPLVPGLTYSRQTLFAVGLMWLC